MTSKLRENRPLLNQPEWMSSTENFWKLTILIFLTFLHPSLSFHHYFSLQVSDFFSLYVFLCIFHSLFFSNGVFHGLHSTMCSLNKPDFLVLVMADNQGGTSHQSGSKRRRRDLTSSSSSDYSSRSPSLTFHTNDPGRSRGRSKSRSYSVSPIRDRCSHSKRSHSWDKTQCSHRHHRHSHTPHRSRSPRRKHHHGRSHTRSSSRSVSSVHVQPQLSSQPSGHMKKLMDHYEEDQKTDDDPTAALIADCLNPVLK